jgi:hypothetical protein
MDNSPLDDWIKSETRCLIYSNNIINWIKPFYDSGTGYYKISYRHNDRLSPQTSPNAASSLIGIIITECAKNKLIPAELSDWSLLEDSLHTLQEHLKSANLDDILPLKSFGFLPLFSIAYLGEFLGNCNDVLRLQSYGIIIRRVIFELYSLRSIPIHPFLLYHCMNALKSFQDHVKIAGSSEISEFVTNFTDVKIVKELYRKNHGKSGKTKKEILREIYGIGNDDFEKEYLNPILTHDKDTIINFIERELGVLRDKAYFLAVDELAKHHTTSGLVSGSDPSSLAFSIAILGELKHPRFIALFRGLVQTIGKTCDRGLFISALPFYLDDQGRYLFVTTVRILHVTLISALRRYEDLSEEDVESLVSATQQMEELLCHECNFIDLIDGGNIKKAGGWPLDRAPFYDRIESWVTMYVFAFFLARIFLLRKRKKIYISRQYNWLPYDKIKTKWEEVIDPNFGTRINGIKDTILSIISSTTLKHEISPMFLLYGPPGTSKTTLVQALASRMNWDLLTLTPSDFICESFDKIEQRSRKIFDELMNLDKCVILLDEMDTFFRDRDSVGREHGITNYDFVVPAILPKLQLLRDYVSTKDMAVFFVTNYYETLDKAIRRFGRIDNHLLILPAAKLARLETALQIFRNMDIPAARRMHVEAKIRSVLEDDNIPCILVYREIERVVRIINTAVEKGTSDAQIKESIENIVISCGISPDTYPVNRDGVLPEFCAVINRLAQVDSGIEDITNAINQNAEGYLLKISTIKGLRENWKEQLNIWIKSLK